MATDAATLPELSESPAPRADGALDTGDAETRITRQFAVFVGAGYFVYIFLTGNDIINAFSVSASWWAVSAPILIFATGIAVGVAGYRGSMRTIRVAVAIAATTYLVTVLAWFPAWNGNHLSSARGMFFAQFNGVPALAIALIWRTQWALLYLAAVAVSVATAGWLVRAAKYTSPLAGEIAWSFGFCMVFVIAASMGIRTARILDATRTETYRIAGSQAALAAREAERGRFDALTHDGVMSTLLGAARQGNTPAITVQARSTIDKLSALKTVDPGDHAIDEGAVIAQLRNTVAEIDDSVDVAVTRRGAGHDTYPAEAVRTLCAAAGEALRNSLRHGGPDARPGVGISFGDADVTVDVNDTGIGFEPARVASHRLGIAVSILGRMRQLPGGSARVESTPGRGTRVELRWAQP